MKQNNDNLDETKQNNLDSAQSFMSLLANHQLKIVTNVQITI